MSRLLPLTASWPPSSSPRPFACAPASSPLGGARHPHVRPLAGEHRGHLVDRRCSPGPQLGGVVAAPDLGERRPRRLLHRLPGLALDPLQLQHHPRLPGLPRHHQDIAAAQTGLPVGADLVARAQPGQEPDHQAVIEALRVRGGGVEVGEVDQEHAGEVPLDHGGISPEEGGQELFQGLGVAHLGAQPGLDHPAQGDGDLGVGDGEPGVEVAVDEAKLDGLEIAGEEEKAPDGARVLAEVAEDGAL